MTSLVKVLLCVVLVGLLMVWCSPDSAMTRRTGWGVAGVGAAWLIAVALWGGV